MDINRYKEKIETLETQLRHMSNDFRLTKEEHERTTAEYLDILNTVRTKNEELQVLKLNLEKIVEKRTKELRESEENFKRIFEHSYDPLVMLNSDLSIIDVNLAFSKMMGYSKAELLKMNILDFPEKKFLKNCRNALDLTFAIGENNHETQFCRRDGGIININMTVKVIDKEKGMIQGVFRDVTEMLQFEEALRLSEMRNRELFNNMSSGAAIYEATEDGSDFIFKDINKTSERLENVKKIDVVGRKVTEAFPGVESFGLLDVFKKVWQTGIPMSHPISFYEDSRVKGWRENYVYKLPHGELVAIYDDITERKQAEEALINSERKFRLMSENITDTIAIYQDNEFCWVNKSTSGVNAIAEADIIGKPLDELISADAADVLLDLQNNESDHKPPMEVEVNLTSGRTRFMEVQSKYIKFEYKDAVQFIFHDITERKEQEKQLQAMIQEKDVLLSEVLHRVKNNLQVVSSLLTFQADVIDNPKYRGIFLESINRVESMAYIHEMLYQSDSFAELNMTDYVNRLSGNLLSTYKKEDCVIKIDIAVDSILLDMKVAIPCGLILNELISNSLKYAFAGKNEGRIKIFMRENSERYITMIVSDDGIGISEDAINGDRKSLGVDLIYLLGENQLKGEVKFNGNSGTRCSIVFKRQD